jgi:hypothetical protein
MPVVIDRAIAFIERNTRHPMKVVGLNRVRLDEYPVEALREALVNAVAHRQYEDAGRKIMLEVFSDRVVVSSPGMPPAPITLARIILENEDAEAPFCYKHGVKSVFEARRKASACLTIAQHSVCCSPRFSPSPPCCSLIN